MARRILQLKSVQETHPNIEITSNEPFFLGRTRESCIQDTLVSRNHINMIANFDSNKVKLKVLGLNPSSLNGQKLVRNTEYTAVDGDVIEVLQTQYAYKICFINENDDIKEKTVSSSENKKRKLSSAEEEQKMPKKRKYLTDIYADAKPPFPDDPRWQSFNNNQLVVFTSTGCSASAKIAAYDMDGTLIATKSGRVFPKDVDDWKIAFPTAVKLLQEKLTDGYKIVILTNQAGIKSGKTKLVDLKKKIESITAALKVPLQAFIATGDSFFRKPTTGMWQALHTLHNNGIELDLAKSYYVGDAAGRPENKIIKRKKDHSHVDRLLALNVGVPFFTPEEHFLKSRTEKWIEPEFDPSVFCEIKHQSYDFGKMQLESNSLEIIVMVGGPGSGKSYFCQSLTAYGYEVVNRDTLGSWQKCVDRMNDFIKAGKKVVVDNTNGNKEQRSRYIVAAKKHKIPCRCFVMSTSHKHAQHNIAFRELTDTTHAKINSIVFNGYKKNYEEPNLDEGFTDITKIDFIPHFENETDRLLYSMYLLSS